MASSIADPLARFNDGHNPISGVWLTPREQFDATGLAVVTAALPIGKAAVAARGVGGKTVVIGEDMAGRVIPTARSRGAAWYDPPNAPPEKWMQNQRDWINRQLDEGCTILDCGAAPGRANFPNPTSPYYQAELDEIFRRGYTNYESIPAVGK